MQKTQQMKRVVMKDTRTGTAGSPGITILTKGTYSKFNAPVVSEENAFPTQQPQ